MPDLGQASRKKNLDPFVRVAYARMHHAEIKPVRSLDTGFLAQFTPGAVEYILARVDFACRQFDKCSAERVTELTLDDQPTIGQHRNDDHRSGVMNVFPRCFVAVRQPNAVAPDIEQTPEEDRFTLEASLLERVTCALLLRAVDAAHRVGQSDAMRA